MGTVVGKWRLKAIIILFLALICIYTVYGIFSNISTPDYTVESIDSYNINENDASS